MTPEEALELNDKETLDSLVGTITGIYEPEIPKGGIYKKLNKLVQNLYLSAGADKLKVVLANQSLFQQTTVNGCTVTLTGNLKKSVFKGYHEVRAENGCAISLDNGGGSGNVSSTQVQTMTQPSKHLNHAIKIPFSLYVRDFAEMMNEARGVLAAHLNNYDLGCLSIEIIREVVGCAYMSYIHGNALVKINAADVLAENWEEFKHPDTGMTLTEMNEKNQERFIKQVVIPCITHLDNSVPEKVIKNACKGLEISPVLIAAHWCSENNISEAAFEAYIKHHVEGDPKPSDYIAAVKQDLIPAIKAYEPKGEEDDIPFDTGEVEEW